MEPTTRNQQDNNLLQVPRLGIGQRGWQQQQAAFGAGGTASGRTPTPGACCEPPAGARPAPAEQVRHTSTLDPRAPANFMRRLVTPSQCLRAHGSPQAKEISPSEHNAQVTGHTGDRGAAGGWSWAPQQEGSGPALPDNKREEFMRHRSLERATIAHQTYRNKPIVGPGPKVRHDLPTGTYMQFNLDPTWELARSKKQGRGQAGRSKIQAALQEDRQPTLSHCDRATRAAASAHTGVHPDALQGGTSSNRKGLTPSVESTGAFNYRQYIESMRRAQ